jgi:PASTA domain
MRRRFARFTPVAVLVVAGLIGASSASAATQTIGSALALPYQGGVCNNNCLSVQQSRIVDVHPVLSPVNGVITEWKVRTGDPDARYSLRVLTPSAGNAYISTTSVLSPAPVPAGTVDTIITYPGNSAAIRQGQAIGLLQTNGGGAGADVGLPQNTTGGVTQNVIANNFNGTFLDGLGATFISDQQHELLLQATVRFCRVPNVVGQTQAAATQALTAAECTATVTKKKTKKKKNKGKVLSQKTAPDSSVAPGTAVEIVVGKKAKKKKKK